MTARDQSAEAIAAHRPFCFSNIRHWSMREWGAILIVAGFLLMLGIIGAPSTGEKELLRTQFHLPDDVALTEVHIDRSSAKPFPAPIEGLVRFTDAQFHQYVARLGDRSIWKPVPISFGGTKFHGPYAADALVWRDLSGARQLGWGSLSWKQAQNARNGVLLCFAVREEGNSAAFAGEPCPPPNSTVVKGIYAQGLLDFETKELHMLIRQTRPGTGTDKPKPKGGAWTPLTPMPRHAHLSVTIPVQHGKRASHQARSSSSHPLAALAFS